MYTLHLNNILFILLVQYKHDWQIQYFLDYKQMKHINENNLMFVLICDKVIPEYW